MLNLRPGYPGALVRPTSRTFQDSREFKSSNSIGRYTHFNHFYYVLHSLIPYYWRLFYQILFVLFQSHINFMRLFCILRFLLCYLILLKWFEILWMFYEILSECYEILSKCYEILSKCYEILTEGNRGRILRNWTASRHETRFKHGCFSWKFE